MHRRLVVRRVIGKGKGKQLQVKRMIYFHDTYQTYEIVPTEGRAAAQELQQLALAGTGTRTVIVSCLYFPKLRQLLKQ